MIHVLWKSLVVRMRHEFVGWPVVVRTDVWLLAEVVWVSKLAVRSVVVWLVHRMRSKHVKHWVMRLMVRHVWVVMSHVHWVKLIIGIVTWHMLEWRHLMVRIVILVDWVVMNAIMRFSWFRELIRRGGSRSSV